MKTIRKKYAMTVALAVTLVGLTSCASNPVPQLTGGQPTYLNPGIPVGSGK